MGYSIYIFINVIVYKIYWSTDQFILGIVANTAIIDIYAISSQINTYYMTLSTAIISVFLPKVTVMASKNVTDKGLSDMFIKIGSLQYIIIGLILSGFILFVK